jgi:ribA/ribD-fused uncharacterized protein
VTAPITSFSGSYRFLSNFYPTPRLEWWGLTFPTSEHAYQWAKQATSEGALLVLKAPTPGAAKRAARVHPMRPVWDSEKNGVMLDIVRAKFTDPDFRRLLVATGDAELVEGNTWNDTYWGVCRGVGENHLGRILMQVRQELLTT